MKPKSKSDATVELNCHNCGKLFILWHSDYNLMITRSQKHFCCSKTCALEMQTKNNQTLNCAWCHSLVTRIYSQQLRTKSGNFFCCKSCSASYNNTQKRKSRRSKCEIRLCGLLQERFKELNILSNDKTMLAGLELDIAIPSLKLGIEWNGVVHFKPIYGQEKLNRIQAIDQRKQMLSADLGINLIVIPDLVSNESTIQEAFSEITRIIVKLIN